MLIIGLQEVFAIAFLGVYLYVTYGKKKSR